MERIVHQLVQGSPEWDAFRLEHDGASEAAAMLGLSKKTKRTELLHMKHTGLPKEFSQWLQDNVLDKGHEVEALARPIAVGIAGVDGFYPATVSVGRLSASCDGVDMLDETAWECKSINQDNRPIVLAGKVPEEHMPQCQQVLMVTGADRLLFTVSDGTRENTHHVWVEPDTDWFDRIRAGWRQFHEDLASYAPPAPAAPQAVADPVEALPAPVIQVTGQLSLQDNFKVFEDRLRDFLANRLIREPKTDEDFVNLDAQIKAMKAGREALKSAKAQMLAQVQPIDLASKTADMLDTLLQKNCKMAEDLLKDEKDRRRDQIVIAGKDAFTNHVAALNKRLGRHLMPNIPTDFGGCVRGLKSLSSMEDKVNTHLANAKIAANEVADKIQINLDYLREHAKDHAFLFADTATIVLKAPDDLAALVQSRIGAHQKAEADRLERERARIAEGERVKAEAKVRAEQEAAAKAEFDRRNAEAKALEAVAPPAQAQPMAEEPAPVPAQTFTPPAPYAVECTEPVPAASPPTMTNGKVCQILGFNVTADFLVSIGAPAPTKQGNANLWHERQIVNICEALGQHLQAVHTAQKAKYQPARSRTPA